MPVRVPLAVTTLVIAAAGVLLTGCGTQSGPVASDSDTATTSSPTRSDKPSTPSPTGSEPVPPFPTAPLPPEPDTEPAPFRQAWERWRTAGVSSYVLVYRIRCACPDDGSVSVRVRDRRVVEARGTQSPLTVRDLFGTVRRAYAQADDVTARYDPASGVPQLLVVDIDERSPDEDVTYEVLRYRPRG